MSLKRNMHFRVFFRSPELPKLSRKRKRPDDRTEIKSRSLTLPAPFRGFKRGKRYLDHEACALSKWHWVTVNPSAAFAPPASNH
jgi:hypothetical protein